MWEEEIESEGTGRKEIELEGEQECVHNYINERKCVLFMKENVCVSMFVKDKVGLCVCLIQKVFVWKRKGERVCVCVCVR